MSILRTNTRGFLKQESGDRSSFAYDLSYLNGNSSPIAHNLPLQEKSFLYQVELPPFFDNLVSEGWLEHAQIKLLSKRQASRFELLLAFGADCAGAFSIIDPLPKKIHSELLADNEEREFKLLNSNSSLSGVQPKMAITNKEGLFYPAKAGEFSTHIAKFNSHNHDDIIFNEYLTTIAFNFLLPEDPAAHMQLGYIEGIDEEVLLISRFDRDNCQRIHFEEFNQLLDYSSAMKYDGSYKDMADFIKNKH